MHAHRQIWRVAIALVVLDTIAISRDPGQKMRYPGGKNGSGVYQRIINLMPPHRVYIEPFLGSGAVFRLKRPAQINIGLDLDPAVIGDSAGGLGNGRERVGSGWGTTKTTTSETTGLECRQIRRCGCGLEFLQGFRFRGDELVYCDPPYLMSTRSSGPLYNFEMPDRTHGRLLRCLVKIPAMVMISGYWSELYADMLGPEGTSYGVVGRGWNSIQFEAMTRGGLATEWLWFNFPVPTALHDYRYLGENFRERERITRKKLRWTRRLQRMPQLERQALLSAIEESWILSPNRTMSDPKTPESAVRG